MGWRYLLFTLGGITLFLWGIRFFVFTLVESPRFLIGLNRDEEAVAVIHRLAQFNSTTTSLTVEMLKKAGEAASPSEVPKQRRVLSQSFALGIQNVKGLFRTKKMAFCTSLLIVIWGKH